LFTWRRIARQKAACLPSTSQEGVLPASASNSSSTIDITFGDAMTRVDAAIDEAHLARVIRAA
jgi:transposase